MTENHDIVLVATCDLRNEGRSYVAELIAAKDSGVVSVGDFALSVEV